MNCVEPIYHTAAFWLGGLSMLGVVTIVRIAIVLVCDWAMSKPEPRR